MNRVKVVMCRVTEEENDDGETKITRHEPEVVEIGTDLASFQGAVGGYIEAVTLAPKIVLHCNEEAIMDGLPFNRSGILGTFFVCGSDSWGNDRSLTDNEITKVLRWLEATKHMPHPSMTSEPECTFMTFDSNEEMAEWLERERQARNASWGTITG
jgi:hypothetical protein